MTHGQMGASRSQRLVLLESWGWGRCRQSWASVFARWCKMLIVWLRGKFGPSVGLWVVVYIGQRICGIRKKGMAAMVEKMGYISCQGQVWRSALLCRVSFTLPASDYLHGAGFDPVSQQCQSGSKTSQARVAGNTLLTAACSERGPWVTPWPALVLLPVSLVLLPDLEPTVCEIPRAGRDVLRRAVRSGEPWGLPSTACSLWSLCSRALWTWHLCTSHRLALTVPLWPSGPAH